jgi:hypothetical protein
MRKAMLIVAAVLLLAVACGPVAPKACEKDSQTCPDGSTVLRQLPSCDFAPCPEAGVAPKACPADAKVCPDGTSVGRTGANCEFAPCPTPEATTCTKTGTDSSLDINEALIIAAQSDCGNRMKGTRICNEGTGTWWIDLDVIAKGCSPACVVDVVAKKAEINWRCTGLIVPTNQTATLGSSGNQS